MTGSEQVIERLKRTTTGGPGAITVNSESRYLPYHTPTQGAGFADAERFVNNDTTTNVNLGDVATASAGVLGILGSVAGSE